MTTEVPGLAEGLRRPGVEVDVEIVLTDTATIRAQVMIPDAASTLGLKAWARTVRRESRDAEDLWRCLEIALADGVTAETLNADETLAQVVPILQRELRSGGTSLDILTAGVTQAEGARRRTRIRALLAAVAGINRLRVAVGVAASGANGPLFDDADRSVRCPARSRSAGPWPTSRDQLAASSSAS